MFIALLACMAYHTRSRVVLDLTTRRRPTIQLRRLRRPLVGEQRLDITDLQDSSLPKSTSGENECSLSTLAMYAQSLLSHR